MGVGCLNVLAQGSQPGLVCTFLLGFRVPTGNSRQLAAPVFGLTNSGSGGGLGGILLKGMCFSLFQCAIPNMTNVEIILIADEKLTNLTKMKNYKSSCDLVKLSGNLLI